MYCLCINSGNSTREDVLITALQALGQCWNINKGNRVEKYSLLPFLRLLAGRCHQGTHSALRKVFFVCCGSAVSVQVSTKAVGIILTSVYLALGFGVLQTPVCPESIFCPHLSRACWRAVQLLGREGGDTMTR